MAVLRFGASVPTRWRTALLPDPQLVLRARIGAHVRWAQTVDRSRATEVPRRAARTALDQALIEQHHLDPESADFDVRLRHARSARFARLALKSAKSRHHGKRSNGAR